MIRNPRDKELPTKQESGNNDDNPPASSRLWQGLKNPRIVRVSKLFGGKDRHSKVSTIRGLRDRRVRLSVPTAIQLYDLQDKLGLGQPSKVVDWLLNAAQHKIDKLPPLPIPLGNYVQLPQSSASFQVAQSQASSNPSTFETCKYLGGIGCSLDLSSGEANDEMYSNDAGVADLGILLKSTDWNLDVPPGNKQKDAGRELSIAKGNIAEVDQVGDRGVGIHGVQTFARGPLPRVGNFSVSGLPNKSMPYASYHQWDPSNTNISYSESHSTEAERHNFSNATLISSSMSVTPGSQLVYYSSGAGTSMIPSYMAASAELDRRQFDHLHMTTSASQDLLLNSLRTHQLDKTTTRFLQSNLAPKQHHSQNPRGS